MPLPYLKLWIKKQFSPYESNTSSCLTNELGQIRVLTWTSLGLDLDLDSLLLFLLSGFVMTWTCLCVIRNCTLTCYDVKDVLTRFGFFCWPLVLPVTDFCFHRVPYLGLVSDSWVF